MAPKGPILPRKSTALKRSRGSLESIAFQIGVLVAVERNRQRLTQYELATAIGVDQTDISHVENGGAADLTDPQFNALFNKLNLSDGTLQREFLKWWRENG